MMINSGNVAATAVIVYAQGNDFHNDKIGVEVYASPVATAGNLHVDLGGGPVSPLGSSLGDNNFRGIGAASATSGPVVVVGGAAVASALTVSARYNIFGSAAPLVSNPV